MREKYAEFSNYNSNNDDENENFNVNCRKFIVNFLPRIALINTDFSNKNIKNSLVSVCAAHPLMSCLPLVVMNKFLRHDEFNPLPYGETKKKQ